MKRKFTRLVTQGELLEGGNVRYNSARYVKGYLQQYEPCKITVLFERKTRSKSKEQLGYLFGVVYPIIADEIGSSIEEVHLAMKTKFLRKKIVWRGIQMTVVKGLSDLKLNETAEFITEVCLEAADLGCIIPEPDKAYQFK